MDMKMMKEGVWKCQRLLERERQNDHHLKSSGCQTIEGDQIYLSLVSICLTLAISFDKVNPHWKNVITYYGR